MSGRRCKALREKFRADFGRSPEPSHFGKRRTSGRWSFTIVVDRESEWRRLKKSYQRDRASVAPQFVAASGRRAAWRKRKLLNTISEAVRQVAAQKEIHFGEETQQFANIHERG